MSGIGDLVAHLTVNHAGFRQGFAAAQATAKKGSSAISAAIAPISGVLAPLTAALGAAFGAGSAISAAKEDLRAMQKLEAVLKATGGAAGLTATEIGAYASELQNATNFGDEVTVGAASILATFKNVKGGSFKEALSLAQDLTTILGGDLSSNAMFLGRALNSPATQLSALSRHGIIFTEQQKNQIKAMQEAGDIAGAQGVIFDKLRHEIGGAAAAVADPWTQLKNVIGDVGEQIGGILLPWVNAVSTGLMDVGAQGVEIFGSLKQTSQEWADAATIAFATMGDTVFLWGLKAELAVVQAASAFAHFFTAQVPAYLSWFADNWDDIFFTAGDYALTVLINLGENIKTAWQGVLDFLSGNPVKFDWKPLTEGAVNAIKAMPDVPARVASEFEKGLQDDIAAQEDFIRKQQEQMAEGIVQQRAEQEAAKGFIPKEAGETPGVAGASKSQDTKFGALQKGSADALSAIFKASRESNLQKQQLEVEEQQLEHLDDIARTLNERGNTELGQWVLPA